MKSPKLGRSTLVSVENITPFGLWLYVNNNEYFLSYKDYPYFKDKTLASIQNVELIHGFHLYWPSLDVDLELDNLQNPEKYLLKDKIEIIKENKSAYETGGGKKIDTVGAFRKSGRLVKPSKESLSGKRISRRHSSPGD